MMRVLSLAVAAAVVATAGLAAPATAQSSGSGLSDHPKSSYYRKGKPQVRGYAKRRGGYSYTIQDTINTYGNSRSNYGSADTYRDPTLDRQTRFGPFDHGFFFDSGILPRGGNSPYHN